MRPPLQTKAEQDASRKADKLEARARKKAEREAARQTRLEAEREVLTSINRLGWWWPGE